MNEPEIYTVSKFMTLHHILNSDYTFHYVTMQHILKYLIFHLGKSP